MKWLLANRTGTASADAFISGLDAIGEKWDAIDPSAWSDHYWVDCDVAVAFGIRGQEQAFLGSAKRRGVPSLVVDLGYVNRFDENFRTIFERDKTLQLSFGDDVGCIPQIECPSNRRIRLGLTYPGNRSCSTGPLVVFGQWPSDPTHPFSDAASIIAWVDEIREAVDGIPVKYRPHPRLTKSDEFLDDALRSARGVVTWSSNSGNDALVAGIPVASKAGPYHEIVADIADLWLFARSSMFPSEHDWERYFNRLAYGQWSFNEFADGTAQRFARAIINGDDPFASRALSGASVRSADKLIISGYAGLGDNVYQRPFIRAAAGRVKTLYIKTPYPEVYADISNIKFIEHDGGYRCSSKNISATTRRFVQPPRNTETVKIGYTAHDLEYSSIFGAFDAQLPMCGAPFVFDLPDTGKSKIAELIGRPFVIVRPATVRAEWNNTSRNPLPEYIAEAVDVVRKAGFVTVSIADVDGVAECFVGDPPNVDFAYHDGQCGVDELIAVTRAAAGVIGGVGWAVPFCIATSTPMLCILGGCGAHNAPHIIAPPNVVDASRITWAIPDRYCMCAEHAHGCDKRITDLRQTIDAFVDALFAHSMMVRIYKSPSSSHFYSNGARYVADMSV